MEQIQRSSFGELHTSYASQSKPPAPVLLRGGKHSLLQVPSFCRTENYPETLPSDHSKGAGTVGALAGTDLHLRQRQPRLPKNVHSFHGHLSATRLRPRRNPTLHCRGKLSSDTAWDRGIGPSQNTELNPYRSFSNATQTQI